MATRGRQGKLTDAVIKKICEAREIGATYEICALYAGVSHASVSGWMRDAREIRERLVADENCVLTDFEQNKLKFLTQLEKSDAAAAVSWLSVVDRAATSDPTWAMRMLQTRYKEYSPAQRQELDLTTKGEKLEGSGEGYDRAVSTLADAIGKALSGAHGSGKGDLDAAERPTVGSNPDEGR